MRRSAWTALHALFLLTLIFFEFAVAAPLSAARRSRHSRRSHKQPSATAHPAVYSRLAELPLHTLLTAQHNAAAAHQRTTAANIVHGENKFTLTRPEGERTYYVWVPNSYLNCTENFPVHLSFHGMGDTAQNYASAVGFQALSETRDFLFVYPQGTVGMFGAAWNAGRCCLFQSSPPDDVGFVMAVVAAVQLSFRVDSKRVFASGFSNGAMFAEILGCEAADILTATASVSGVVELDQGNAEGLKKCSTDYAVFNKKVATLNIHGTSDWKVPWTGDALLGFPSIPDNFQAWATRNECTGNPTTEWTHGDFTLLEYANCTGGAVVQVVKWSGSHAWPESMDFNATGYIVDFFKQF